MKTRYIVVGLAALVLVVLVTAAAVPVLRGMIGSDTPGLPVYTVEQEDFVHRVYADGHLKAVDATLLGPPPEVTDSLKIAWLADNGSRVEEGDVVIRFDPTDMEESLRRGKHDKATAQSKIVQKEAQERATSSNLERDSDMASLELDYAEQFQNKDRRIFSRAEIIESEIDQDLATRKRDHAAQAGEVHSELAQTELDLLVIGRRQAEIKIEHAEQGLAALEVRAPHAGIFVLKEQWGRSPEVGQMVWGGNPIAELPKLDEMEAEVFVLEADAGGLKEGLAARLVIEAHPEKEYGATVKKVDAVAQRRNRRVPVQYFRVTLDLSETEPALMKPGQRVRSVLTLDELEDVVAVPRQAIFEDEGKKIVYRREEGRFNPVEVELGATALGRVVVAEGLSPGDRIALRDPTRPVDVPAENGADAASGPMGAGRWSFVEALRSALGNLAAHKLRSALTMLGMIFGVGAVIAMMSIGAGANRRAMEMIERMGVRNVLVRSKQNLKREDLEELRKKSLGVSERDALAILDGVPGVELAAPIVEVDSYKIMAGGESTEAKVLGVSHLQQALTRLEVASGRFIDRLDERRHDQVAVIGSDIARNLFGYEPALGRQFKINDVWFEVVGVLGGSGGAESFEGVRVGTPSEEIYVPVSTALRKFDRDPLEAPLDEIVVRLEPSASPRATATTIRGLLDRIHAGAEDFELVVPEALLQQSRRTQQLFKRVMGGIAGISLLVGGIGIMNIMLATVLERTREIGVRRAVGARCGDIRMQFIVESFAISLLGGISGVVMGVAIAGIVAAYAGWPTVVTATSILLSTMVSLAVGLVSGIYPAVRAAELDPIDALRHE